ncbi:cytochrome P450 [Gymnopilus junonius]|uniref:Cytochrome P450 n=1 Tax=Gymnopilus junonius TaxID=109634 RepID=A0A9P5NKV7_GYMJU|nr:cytochrome P450 [Gymnopilus junonius]
MFETHRLIVWKVISYWLKNSQSAPYPPGPKPKPLIGNALDLPTSSSPEMYVEWGKKYQSDFVYASALDADEILDRRARKYSDRPALPILKLMDWEWNLASQRYGASWRFHRTICQQNFRAVAARDYYPPILEKTHEMLHRLLEDPDNFEEHNKMLSISIPMMTMYGYEVKSFQDSCIVAADESLRLGASLLLPGGTWINVIPALRYIPSWFPGATARRDAAKIRELTKEVQRIPLEFVKKEVENGTAIPSFVSNFLRKKRNAGALQAEEEAVYNIANTVCSAASDTTISATSAFFYLMAVNPDIQRKAQAEIDRVVGTNRLPDFEDRASLPYIEALYREVLRFAPPIPLGLPHALTEDDYYKGYYIPKGDTVVLGNIWAMTRDEDLYPDPLKFKPERFLDKDGNVNDDKRVLAYGFGRRVCAGKYIASATTWIVMASVLACFNIEKAKDEFGNEIGIKDDYDDFGILRHKSKFRCSFVPRSLVAKQLIQEAK